MNKVLLCFFIFFLSNTLVFALPTSPKNSKEQQSEVVAPETIKTTTKQKNKLDRKAAKFTKKWQKIERKLKRKGIRASHANSVWDNENFKLGALVALGGLLLTILGFLPFLGAILKFIGVLMMLVGIGIMIWTLIEA